MSRVPEHPDAAAELKRRIGAGFLRNTVRERGRTCVVCTTPIKPEYSTCFPCNQHQRSASAHGHRLAHLVVPLSYAISGSQSGHLMRGYKTAATTSAALEQLRLLFTVAFFLHRRCFESITGRPITAWSSVPSTKTPRKTHPIRDIARSPQGMEHTLTEVTLTPGPGFTRTPPQFLHDMWSVQDPPPGEHHVMLVDDTWTTGAHAQSAAAALRRAGSTAVPIVVLARWLDPAWGPTSEYMQDHPIADYDIFRCPASGGECPE